jgi:hypothetical protein
MRKTPSYLKGLAETRARSAGDVARLRKLYEEIGQKLEEAQAEQAACDRLIQKYDSRLEPSRIPNINGWQGRYGKRGALRAAILRFVEEAWPSEITTTELCWQLQMKFQLDFFTAQERAEWLHNSVYTRLRYLVKDGDIESCHNPSKGVTGEVGRWRWRSETAPSLDHLRELASAAEE